MSTKQATVRTEQLWRDKAGYEIVSRPSVLTPVGRHIEGKSGKLVPVVYSIAPGKVGEPWRKASRQLCRIKDMEGLCAFMSEFGPIDSSDRYLVADAPRKQFAPGSDDARKYGLGYIELAPPQSLSEFFANRYINNVATLEEYSSSGDDAGFLTALGGELTKAVLRPTLGGLWVTELPSMLALLKYDMWSKFGESRASSPTRRICDNCGTTMHVGGGRRKRGRMATARFCSDKCRVGYHLRQKRYEARAVAS